jgi:uncharacterized protein
MTCPICGKLTTWQDEPKGPFCSERCKLIDFGNWADEGYRVPDQEGAPEQFEKSDEQSPVKSSQSTSH